MKNKIFYLAILSLLFISCSEDKPNNSEDTTTIVQKSKTVQNENNGAVPNDAHISKILRGDSKVATLDEMIALYKEDSKKSQGTSYDTNLKNMWLILIYNRLLNGEGTPEQEKFFLYEQVQLEHNLPHVGKFYKLLANTRSVDKNEKEEISKLYREKNQKAINTIVWNTPEEKKQKEEELLLARRNYGILSQY